MILRYERLHRFPIAFKSMTGLHVAQFDALRADEGLERSEEATSIAMLYTLD